LGQNFEVWLIHQIFGLMESSIVSFVVDHVYGSHVWENLWDKCRESFVLNYYGNNGDEGLIVSEGAGSMIGSLPGIRAVVWQSLKQE